MTDTDPALTERVADAIHSRVIGGDWPAGMWLRQSQLAEQFEVSRTPIREALQTLQARGVVELIPNRGARIRLPTLRELREAYFVRAVLEGAAADLAADLASQQQLDRLLAAERLFEASVDAFAGSTAGDEAGDATAGARGSDAGGERWQAANDQFHEVIHEAAHNEVLASTIRTVHRRFPRNLTWGALSDMRQLRDNVDQHREIREAIERRDRDAARRLMQAHVQRSGELLAARLTTLPA